MATTNVRQDTAPIDVTKRDRMQKALKYLRMFLQDTPATNKLIDGQELDAEELEFCILMCISDWNSTAPLTGAVDISNFPSLFLLMHGSAIQALKMSGVRMSRNELNYQSGGSSFMRWNKTALYQSWISLWYNDYEIKKKNFKICKNLAAGYGEIWSEYEYVGFW